VYAIEYETGRKELGNSRNMIVGRLAKYNGVIVVVNENSFDLYKKSFHDERIKVITVKELEKIKEFVQ
ncbi:MAG: hypothetical protein ACHQX1_03355, partial [Candidatus Micrarchaeales archaeon]